MSTDPAFNTPTAPQAKPEPVAAKAQAPGPRTKRGWLAQLLGSGGASDEIVVYHHSTLFYWWPVWLLGFIFAGWTYYFGGHLAIVPEGTQAVEKRQVDVSGEGKEFAERNVLVLPQGKDFAHHLDAAGNLEVDQPGIKVAMNRRLGTIYALVLLIVIAMTNIAVRGLWSVFIVLLVVMLTIIFALSGWWSIIFRNLGQLSVYMNMGGYLLISSVLFVLWLVNVLIFDRQTYMIFTPGQVRVRLVIGGEETVYDATGMVVQRLRNDLFRHFVLGFGSGDLLIRPVGQAHPLELDNVLNVNKVVRRIETLVKERVIVRAGNAPA
jgi:hypothetical protein